CGSSCNPKKCSRQRHDCDRSDRLKITGFAASAAPTKAKHLSLAECVLAAGHRIRAVARIDAVQEPVIAATPLL
ncbi:MAG: hypothetical protein ABL934_16850, partial [Lysobacteraceae bacterium]